MIQIYLLAAATLAFLLSPSLTDPFTGYAPGSFPVEQIDPPVQPAGYAFAIWGVIYIWLGVMAAYAVLRRKGEAGWQSTAVPLALSLGPGAAWLWVAGFAPLTATVLIFWMMGFAILALLRAPATDRWWLQAPVALYAGWLTAAAHVSLGVVLGGYGWLSGTGAAVLCILLALGVAVVVLWRKPQAPEYGAAVGWALIGIAVDNAGANTTVMTLALVGLAVVAAIATRGALKDPSHAA
ncbi:hypothetical protein M3N55_13695 [Roseibaca sp. V10]|uniref:Tryptophan-rich sensory protein n=1 Tax=Roseinatronobacter domitianus TaxID=2940293 RepID=A0ABT0M4K1_9RHOB|nr:hypothetical protein [Roseibaca domitiana]MCL1629786.1 hypothetical protein [Roseibaca domitiana]